ncbi:MAG: hypothetical protein WA766_01875 [Candidatus Acidiferrales bacterium]
MKFMLGTFALLFAVSTFAQAPPIAQIPTQQQASVGQLQDDSRDLPARFKELSNQVNFDKWACALDGKEDNIELIVTYSNQLTNLSYIVDTIEDTNRPTLSQASDATYTFGLGVPTVLTLSRAADCTGQTELADKFTLLSIGFSDAARNSHEIEGELIQAEENMLQRLFNTIKSLKQPANPMPLMPKPTTSSNT